MTPAGRRRRALVDAIVQVAALGGLVGGWELIVRLLGVPRSIVPAPSVIGAELVQIHGLLAAWSAYTMTTALEGYALAVAGGIVLAIVLESSPALERGLFPFFVASQAVPIIAFSAVVILWLGNGPLSKVAIAFYLSFFPITISVVKGLQSCDPAAVALLRTFGAGRAQLLWKLRMPVMLPFLFVAMRIATSTALIGAIVGEWFGDNRGIGTFILQALYAEDTVRLWCGIVCCAAMGVVFYGAVTLVERRLLWWPAPALD
ncbi:MAG TPA: ABC transporter permease [Candidatus Bathyarchaeia archaeon]|nr:ABC transporter permease [Candidatus Bathyarchaeia archaeon]